MTVKDRVLDALEANRGAWFSGGALAQTLGVSRSAVWKAVSQLREGGYPIRAASNRGYSLEADSAILSAQSVGKYLTAPGVTVEVRPTVTSTNDLLRQQAEAFDHFQIFARIIAIDRCRKFIQDLFFINELKSVAVGFDCVIQISAQIESVQSNVSKCFHHQNRSVFELVVGIAYRLKQPSPDIRQSAVWIDGHLVWMICDCLACKIVDSKLIFHVAFHFSFEIF